MREKSKVVFQGSFDPFTNGHLDIVKKCSAIFDEVYVVISKNSRKERVFDVQTMEYAIERVLGSQSLFNCKVYAWDGLITDFAQEHGIRYMARGIRNTLDYGYEESMADVNTMLCPDLEYVYFRADQKAISSSMVRELMLHSQDVRSYVPWKWEWLVWED